MFIVTYLNAVCFKEILVSVPSRWRDKSAETFSRNVKTVRVNYRVVHLLAIHEIYFIKMHRLNNVNSLNVIRNNGYIEVQ